MEIRKDGLRLSLGDLTPSLTHPASAEWVRETSVTQCGEPAIAEENRR